MSLPVDLEPIAPLIRRIVERLDPSLQQTAAAIPAPDAIKALSAAAASELRR
jgi:hypothetical protein